MEDCQEWSECGALFRRVAGGGGAPPTTTPPKGPRAGFPPPPPPGTTPLAKHHLRPAGQSCRNGAKVIAAGNRDPRQLFRQRFLDQR